MITISNYPIRMLHGLYCLNDLHKASGGKVEHKPTFFLRNEQTKEVIRELQNSNSIENIVRVKRGGSNQGTWVSKELVYSYARWISAKFHVAIIHTFDTVVSNHQKLDRLCRELSTINTNLSNAGRLLCIGGKQIKPQIKQRIDRTLNEMQPSLNLVGGGYNGIK